MYQQRFINGRIYAGTRAIIKDNKDIHTRPHQTPHWSLCNCDQHQAAHCCILSHASFIEISQSI